MRGYRAGEEECTDSARRSEQAGNRCMPTVNSFPQSFVAGSARSRILFKNPNNVHLVVGEVFRTEI